MLYTVKEKLFKETFFLVYGEGGNAHRQPITLYDGKIVVYYIIHVPVHSLCGKVVTIADLKNHLPLAPV
jgi:hypothetical protein